MKVLGTLIFLVLLCLFGRLHAVGQVQLQRVTAGLTAPVLITHASDRRLFIVEQRGTVRIFYGGELMPTPFLNITSVTINSGEAGLLGLAFHPRYREVPHLFVHFTSNGTALPDGTQPTAGDNLIVRYNVSTNDPNVVDHQSAKVLMRVPNASNVHHGGMIAFGPDGYLHIAKGDGGGANDPDNRSQNIEELAGKILRINVDENINTPPYYSIPPSNPFVSGPGRDEIFLLGLRNPWRFSFDRLTGDMWIGDVGQERTEEINRLPMDPAAPGSNFGWRIFEGTNCTDLDPCSPPAKYVPPVFTYLSGGTPQCSVTGGYVYRGSKIPSLSGVYVFGDFCTGEVWALSGGVRFTMADTDQLISSFGEGSTGELYMAGLVSGEIYKVVSNWMPKAGISGRIFGAPNQKVIDARVTRTAVATGEERVTWTNPFGYYEFPDNDLNQEYIISVTPRLASTAPEPRRFTLTDDFYGVDFRMNANQGSGMLMYQKKAR